MATPDDFDAQVHAHDALLRSRGQMVWAGSEPTFTDPAAQTPEWLSVALGEAKQERALALAAGLWRRRPHCLLLRCTGRRYPGEPAPRWSLVLYGRRDGETVWDGPPDPSWPKPEPETVSETVSERMAKPAAVAPEPGNFADRLRAQGLRVRVSRADLRAGRAQDGPEDGPESGPEGAVGAGKDERDCEVPAANAGATPDATPALLLDRAWLAETPASACPRLELPPCASVPEFLAMIAAVGRAARAAGLERLILGGAPPPADPTVELTTIAPDPAVIEVSTAPSADAADFLARRREIDSAAAAIGLAPCRLYFNGAVADSGGGGQITLGGPTPAASPFIADLGLLPSLVRYAQRHPALSYLWSHDFVGIGGQSVRADERGHDAFDEFVLALDALARRPSATPEQLWLTLSPFLCDGAGNLHRAELNIEKLWNPWGPESGRQGLLEFRALRMQQRAERATAIACLLRALVAMLRRHPDTAPLRDWGRELHERFAMPFYLEHDLDQILRDLDNAGFGLGAAIVERLRAAELRRLAAVALPDGCTLELWRALEFWPLLGDVASAEQGGPSRLIDASTTRIELRLRSAPGSPSAAPWHDWSIATCGMRLPMRAETDRVGSLGLYALRYRAFVPARGLHPALPAQTPVVVGLRHPRHGAHRLEWHEWHPDGGAYDGLPHDLAQAAERRAQRLVLSALPAELAGPRALPPAASGPYLLDLRALA